MYSDVYGSDVSIQILMNIINSQLVNIVQDEWRSRVEADMHAWPMLGRGMHAFTGSMMKPTKVAMNPMPMNAT